jgi:MFS family permease
VATNAVTLLIGATTFANFLLTSQFAQVDGAFGFGYSATAAGLLMLPSSVTTFLAGPLVNRIGRLIGMRNVLVLGALGAGFGTAIPAVLDDRPWHFVLSGALLGLGAGLVLAASANLVVDLVPEDEVGVATGLNTVFRTVGAAVGSVVLASVLQASIPAVGGDPTEGGYQAAYLVAGCSGLLAGLLALGVPRGRAGRTLGSGSLRLRSAVPAMGGSATVPGPGERALGLDLQELHLYETNAPPDERRRFGSPARGNPPGHPLVGHREPPGRSP